MKWLGAVPIWLWWALALLVVGGGQQVRVGASQLETAKARQELADQASAYQREREASALAVIDWQTAEQARQQKLEARLQAADKKHHQELTNAQRDQARLRDRLATSDLRLSVILANTATNGSSGVSASSGSSSVVHGTSRAELDPAHAQRIIAITDDGDYGMIALAACQAYVHELQGSYTGVANGFGGVGKGGRPFASGGSERNASIP